MRVRKQRFLLRRFISVSHKLAAFECYSKEKQKTKKKRESHKIKDTTLKYTYIPIYVLVYAKAISLYT